MLYPLSYEGGLVFQVWVTLKGNLDRGSRLKNAAAGCYSSPQSHNVSVKELVVTAPNSIKKNPEKPYPEFHASHIGSTTF